MKQIELPQTHKEALAWLYARGSQGLIDRWGRVLACGDRYKSADSAGVWLRLAANGYLEGLKGDRIGLTLLGTNVAAAMPPEPRDQHIPHSPSKGMLMMDDDPEDFA